MDKMPERTLLLNLRTILTERFDEEELRTLCSDIPIDYDQVQGSGKIGKVRELVAYCERRRITARLISRVLDSRPDTLSALLTESVFSPPEDTGGIPFAALDPHIYFFDIRRREMTQYYLRWTEAANRIDIITLSMQAIFENYDDDQLIDWLMDGKEFRVLVLSPTSAGAKIREKEEGISLPSKIVTQIKTLKCIYERAQQRIADEGKKPSGSLEVRFYDGIPYFAYFGTEREIVLGLYYAQKKGLQSEVFLVNVKSPVYKDFQRHFRSLWDGRDKDSMSLEERLVCVISASNSYFIDLNALKKTTGKARQGAAWKPG